MFKRIVSCIISLLLIGALNTPCAISAKTLYETNTDIAKGVETLKSAGLSDKQINAMPKNSILESANLKVVSSNHKYYKFTEVNQELITPISTLNSSSSEQNSVEEISKEEFNTSNPVLTRTSVNQSVTVSYLQVSLVVLQSAANKNEFSFKGSGWWKALPSSRSMDAIGVGISSNLIIQRQSYFSSIQYDENRTNRKTRSTFNPYYIGATGAGEYWKLPSDGPRTFCFDIMLNVSFRASAAAPSSSLQNFFAVASYAHQLSTWAVVPSFSIGSSGAGLSLSPTQVNKFDRPVNCYSDFNNQ